MEEVYILLIKRSDPLHPTAERLAEYKGCKYVDSIASEIFDAIGIYEGGEKELRKICRKLGIDWENVKRVNFYLKNKRKRGPIPFWLRIPVKIDEGLKEELKKVEFEEIYLTDDEIFMRSKGNSSSHISTQEDKVLEQLEKYLDLERRTITYFVFRKFS